jgi:predicted RNA polymerase sigma factor
VQSGDQDDTLTLLFLCCHPSLSVPAQLALTLRAVGGLSTAEIANAFLLPESTMAQRISRAKQSIKSAGVRLDPPPEAERADRLRVVLHVLYLVFNEGYTTSSGPALQRADLTIEAIRLTRLLQRLLPEESEVAGLLALMLLTDARRGGTRPGRWHAGAASRAATRTLERGPDRRRDRALDAYPWRRADRAVPGAGGNRGGP